MDLTCVTNFGFDNRSPIEGLGGFPNSEKSLSGDCLVVVVVVAASTIGDASGDGGRVCGCR